MIGEQNLRVIQGEHGAGRCFTNVEGPDTAYPSVLVGRRLLKAFREFIARPFFSLPVLHELNLGFRREGLCNEIRFPQSMRCEVKLNSGSWAILGGRGGWWQDLCPGLFRHYDAEQE